MRHPKFTSIYLLGVVWGVMGHLYVYLVPFSSYSAFLPHNAKLSAVYAVVVCVCVCVCVCHTPVFYQNG